MKVSPSCRWDPSGHKVEREQGTRVHRVSQEGSGWGTQSPEPPGEGRGWGQPGHGRASGCGTASPAMQAA